MSFYIDSEAHPGEQGILFVPGPSACDFCSVTTKESKANIGSHEHNVTVCGLCLRWFAKVAFLESYKPRDSKDKEPVK